MTEGGRPEIIAPCARPVEGIVISIHSEDFFPLSRSDNNSGMHVRSLFRGGSDEVSDRAK